MTRNPYEALGVAKTATAGEIKTAFRRLAKKFHPDQSKEPKAKERFAEANQAYEIIGDEKKKAAFDRGEIDADGKPRAPEGFGQGFGFDPRRGQRPGAGAEHFEFNFGGNPFARGGQGGADTADILSELFGAAAGGRGGRARAPQRGDDIALTAYLSLETAATGGPVRVSLPNGKTMEVNAPAATIDGAQMRLRGQGMSGGPGTTPGDAVVTLKFAPHPKFKVEGRDLRLDLPLTIYEAWFGAKAEAPTLQGAVELTIPPRSNSGRTLRLRGKGLPAAGGAAAGDLLVSLQMVWPENPGADFEAALREMQTARPYAPRKDKE